MSSDREALVQWVGAVLADPEAEESLRTLALRLDEQIATEDFAGAPVPPAAAGAKAAPERVRGGAPGERTELDLVGMRARAEAVAAVVQQPLLSFDDLQLLLDLRPTALRKLLTRRGFPAAIRIGGRPLWRTPTVIGWLDTEADEARAFVPD